LLAYEEGLEDARKIVYAKVKLQVDCLQIVTLWKYEKSTTTDTCMLLAFTYWKTVELKLLSTPFQNFEISLSNGKRISLHVPKM
jgi:hypothetical protein